MPRTIRIASVNVNGVRAATRKGMLPWLESEAVDVLALQEVRATREQLEASLPGWIFAHDEAIAKGRSGVAVGMREDAADVRTVLGGEDLESSGRWIEVDIDVDGERVAIVSVYVPTGDAGDPVKQERKYAFMDAMEHRMRELSASAPLALVMGDLNIGHRQIDIRNWKGNLKKSGFLPRERAYFDRLFGPAGEEVECCDGTTGTGAGWVDVGRETHGEVDGPYTWWSMRGKAFDTDTGWRIDYHVATPQLAQRVSNYRVVRAPSWGERWSDHAPVIADYQLGL